ncbi:DUF4232 domain-containing protein [Streptomyces sp. 35G-GA-8]|uniref:DUF4232 domain-containing protein n=1 Tax=Streptomyces sp. 35G-GA-8 TaxID=2939434 RepID=UPI00201E79CB|nr:DUF4232 domain-containing protein [Streptomyces sp. 35G-GA-8]MCL7378496.1 DUF4232 domain-containing protein [Streptomyces sp. 35G-GA-8]
MAASIGLLAFATAACGGGGGGSPASAPEGSGGRASSAPSASAPVESGGDGAPSVSSAPPSSKAPVQSAPPAGQSVTGQAAAASSRCTADQLGLSLSAPDVGAGNIRYDLRLVNKGAGPCALRGFPGVSLLAGDGAIIGKPATREGEQLPAVTLAPGGTADVTLHTLNRGIKGSSCWAAPSLLRIYPPGSKDAMTLRTSKPVVCGDTFTVTAVRSG